MNRNKRAFILIFVVLSIFSVFCGSTGEEPDAPGGEQVERGWLCDYDGRGEVAIWSKAELAFQNNNSIVATVGMSVNGGVDVILLEETTNDGILFYRIRVDGKTGWVDVDYFYPSWMGKPSWSR